MKYFKIFLILLVFYSCSNMLVKKSGLLDDHVEHKHINLEGKDIVYVGTRHLGIEAYYENMQLIIDSLKTEDYHFVLEGESDLSLKANKIDTTMVRKIRKVLPTLFNGKSSVSYLIDKYNLKNQVDYGSFGISENQSSYVDESFEYYLKKFENTQGEIKLDSCDLGTTLDDTSYDCEVLPKSQRKYFMDTILKKERELKLVKFVAETQQEKIAIIYGIGHMKPVIESLKLQVE